MAHNVIIKRAVAAFNVDSYNRTAVYTDTAHPTYTLDNGAVFTLTRTDAEDLRWTVTAPAATTTTGLWMATSPEVVYVDKAHGGTADPRDFVNTQNMSIDATLLVKGDIIEMTGEGIANIATKNYLVVDASTFTLKAADAAGTGLCLKKIGASTLHIGDGAIAPAATPTYVFEVVNN